MSLLPQLPPRYRWVETVEDDGPLLRAHAIPVLLPAEADRARRWADVLHSYAPADERPAVRAGARVASLPGHERLGQLVAQALSRPHHVLDPHRPLAAGDRGGSVLVVAPAAALPLRVLTAIVTACAEQDTETGFLTGRDAAAVTFALAKLLAAPGPDPGPARSGLVDGTTGLAHVLSGGEIDERSTVADVLGQHWTSIIVDADGSAAHAPLGALTLCGLTGAAEHTLDGTVLPGGCTPTGCKTDPSGRTRPFALHNLKTRALGVFVCNGITLGPAEQYPSNLSLALDALEGFPQAVFGLTRGDLDTSGREPRLAAESLHAGDRLGQCVALLNTDGERRGIRGPSTVLLGDPEQRLHIPGPRTSPHPRPQARRQPADTHQLGDWQRRLTDAHAVERGLHASLQRRPDPDLAACLEEMTSHRERAADQLLAAVRDASPTEEWEPRLQAQSEVWAHTALAILSRTRGGAFSRQLIASRAHHRTGRWSAAGPCPYCHAPRDAEHLTSPIGLTDRRTIRCPKCGPALSLPAGLHELEVKAPAALHPGEVAEIALRLPESAGGVLAVHLRPRSTRRGSYDHQVIAATPGPHTIRLTMPEHPMPELDRLWVVHAHRFHIAYYQQRLPVLPPTTTPAA